MDSKPLSLATASILGQSPGGRRYWITGEIDSLSMVSEWKRLKSIGMVERECWSADKKTIEKRFFIRKIVVDAKKFSQAVRGHWGVENPLHWQLDVILGV